MRTYAKIMSLLISFDEKFVTFSNFAYVAKNGYLFSSLKNRYFKNTVLITNLIKLSIYLSIYIHLYIYLQLHTIKQDDKIKEE